MLINRLPYKFFLLFLVFSIVLIIPFSFIIYFDSQKMIGALDEIWPLTAAQKAVYDRYTDSMMDNIISYSFYIFIIAFILSMFFSRRLLHPVRELYRGATALKNGDYDIRLDITTNDELAEVTSAFNDMATVIKEKTNELMRKDQYLKTMLDPIWVIDDDNIIIDINPAFTKLFGYQRDDVIGYSIFDYLDEESERTVRRKLFDKESGQPSSYEISVISKHSGLMPVLMSGSVIVVDGEQVGKIGIMTDFREQLALREALREEMEKSEAIMDSMVEQIVVIDKNYKIIKANLSARINAGRDITGEDCHCIMHGRKEACFLYGEDCPVKTVFETGKNFKVVHEHQGPGGKKIFHEIIAYPVKDKHGDVKSAVESMRDITERKRFQDEIETKNRELATINSISKILSRSLRAEDIFMSVLDKVVSLLGMSGGGIFFLDEMGREMNFRFHRGLSEDFAKSISRVRLGDDIPGRVALTGQAIMSQDIAKDPRAARSLLRHSGIKGVACVPIRGKEKLLGVFFAFSFNTHLFNSDEERMLNSISELMGISFENISLYEKMRSMYEQFRSRRAEEQKSLLGLSTMLSGSLDISKALESSLSLVRESCKADFAWLLELNDAGEMSVKAASDPDLKEGDVVCGAETSTIERFAIDRNDAIKLSDISQDPKFFVPKRVEAYRNACSVPMSIGERKIGALSVYIGTSKVPTDDEVHFLRTVSSVLAVALERARLYQNVIMQKGMSDAVLESITDGVVSVDNRGRVSLVNSAAEHMLGIRQFSTSGRRLSECISESEENTELKWKIERGFEDAVSGSPFEAESHISHAGGGRLPLRFKAAPIKDSTGTTTGVVFIVRDLSRDMELDVMKTDFVKSVSHEFRTPLTAIVGMTEMVLEGDVDIVRSRTYLNTILNEGNRLSDMVSDLLDVARIESGKEVFKESDIDFRTVMRHTEDSFSTAIRKKDIKVKMTVEDIKGYMGDYDKLMQLFRNLLENSITYSDIGSSLSVDIKAIDGFVDIMVEDTGWGMADADLVHAGEKFYRGAYSSKTKGTGLGLSLCRAIVGMHGGEIQIKSKQGKGTHVHVTLPLERVRHEEDTRS